eukprot:1142608-Pelagomonas_calceolata.AAC.8
MTDSSSNAPQWKGNVPAPEEPCPSEATKSCSSWGAAQQHAYADGELLEMEDTKLAATADASLHETVEAAQLQCSYSVDVKAVITHDTTDGIPVKYPLRASFCFRWAAARKDKPSLS